MCRDRRDERQKVATIIRKALNRRFPGAPKQLIFDFSTTLSDTVHAYLDERMTVHPLVKLLTNDALTLIRKEHDEKVAS